QARRPPTPRELWRPAVICAFSSGSLPGRVLAAPRHHSRAVAIGSGASRSKVVRARGRGGRQRRRALGARLMQLFSAISTGEAGSTRDLWRLIADEGVVGV